MGIGRLFVAPDIVEQRSRCITMITVNWRAAPSWAMFCAWDADGYFSWFAERPVAQDFGKYWDGLDGKSLDDHQYNDLNTLQWDYSLQSRQLELPHDN